MSENNKENQSLDDFILRNVEDNPSRVGVMAAAQFQVSRTTISNHMHGLIARGLLSAEGKTNARKYALQKLVSERHVIKLTPGIAEDQVWREYIQPHMAGLPKNIVDICRYGFTEIFNNAIDHSGSPIASILFDRTYATISMRIVDLGIGIFEKIRRDFNLEDASAALLELSKGKLTSDPKRHSGEGIFFTSRMFREFGIQSDHLSYVKTKFDEDDGWLFEGEREENSKGTYVSMKINTDAPWTSKEIFDRFQDDDYHFAKTHVPIMLGLHGDDQLVSRSQAKRIMARIEKFSEAILDFEGVGEIGQAFADEIFRVYKNEHPHIRLVAYNTNEQIDKMIAHVTPDKDIIIK